MLADARIGQHADLDVAGDEIEHRIGAALIGDVNELDAGFAGEIFGDPVADRADAGRDIFDAAAFAFRPRHEIGERAHAEIRMHHEGVRRAAEKRDMGEIAHRIEADILVHRRPEHMGRDAGDTSV